MILEHKGINIFFETYGQGNPIVLLHGFLENSSMWQPFMQPLSKNNQVITIDLLGHGKTGCLGYIHSMELMAEIVEVVLNSLKITKTTLIGHSMGGYVALAFAEKHPDKLHGLCLMNSTAHADTPEKKINRDRAIEAVKQNHKTFIRIAINNLFRPKNRTLFATEIKAVINAALQTPLQGIIAALEGMKIRNDRTPILNEKAFKIMMIASKKDPVLDYNMLVEQIKNTHCKLVTFPDGHMSHIENKDIFLQEIMHFID